MARKKWEELDVIDNALINALATDQRVAVPFFRRLISVLLEREVGNIRVIGESIIPGQREGLRGVRLDVEIEEDEAGSEYLANVYDVESHLQDDYDFPRMLRYRQARIDSKHMKSGDDDFRHLPNLYILFITNFDIWGKDRMVYTFRHACVEEPELTYDDGLRITYFNTSGKLGGSKSIENMLHFIEDSRDEKAVDEATQELNEYVTDIKNSEEGRIGYMTLGNVIDREVREETRSLREQLEQNRTELRQRDAQIKQNRTELEQNRTELRQRDAQIKRNRTELRQRDAQIEQKDALILELKSKLAEAGL